MSTSTSEFIDLSICTFIYKHKLLNVLSLYNNHHWPRTNYIYVRINKRTNIYPHMFFYLLALYDAHHRPRANYIYVRKTNELIYIHTCCMIYLPFTTTTTGRAQAIYM